MTQGLSESSQTALVPATTHDKLPTRVTGSALNLLLCSTQVEMNIHVNIDRHATKESNSNSNRHHENR